MCVCAEDKSKNNIGSCPNPPLSARAPGGTFDMCRENDPDLSRIFLLSILSLHLDSQLSIESSNHQKIGDINEALRICKQATQIASV